MLLPQSITMAENRIYRYFEDLRAFITQL